MKTIRPEVVPDPVPKKSPQEQLDELDTQLDTLEEKRKELLLEIAKEEARHDGDFLEEIHKECLSEDDFREAQEQAAEAHELAEDLEEAWDYLERFGGHTATCCEGALAATQKLHRLCTCGWNEVATALERA